MGRDVAGFRPVKSNVTNQAQKALPEKVEVKVSEPDNQKQDELGAKSSTSDEPEEQITSAETDDSGANDQHSPTTTKQSQVCVLVDLCYVRISFPSCHVITILIKLASCDG